jgi:DNA repair protein RadC
VSIGAGVEQKEIILFKKHLSLLKTEPGAGEMAQRLRAPTALLKILSSNASNHMVAHNHPRGLTPSSGVSEDSYSVLTYNK